MKQNYLFYLPNCPHCKQALSLLDIWKKEGLLDGLEVQLVNESQEAELANQFDYYYVPCLFSNGEKLYEGRVNEEKWKEALLKAKA